MSKSYRTQPEHITAARKLTRSPEVKVFERKCIKGDYHPLNKRMIKEFLSILPVEYVYGLTKIELLDRNSRALGEPYAIYRENEKSILIYSVPKQIWSFKSLGDYQKELFSVHGASETEKSDSIEIVWKYPLDLAYFMFQEIFLHELGHHFINQYRHKNIVSNSDRINEKCADLHAEKLSKKALFYDIWKKSYRA